MQQVTVDCQAADYKGGMTLAEMERFVRDARNAGLTGDEPIKVRTGWNSQIRVLQVSGEPHRYRSVFTTPTGEVETL